MAGQTPLVPTRHAARVVVLTQDGQVLLMRGHDVDLPQHSWWFTVGGGIEGEESPVDAAVRELREETGIDVDPAGLEGPVMRRVVAFDFARTRLVQEELVYLLRLPAPVQLSREGWTSLERETTDELSWLAINELEDLSERVFPAALPKLVRGWQAGWDGRLVELAPVIERTDPEL